MTTELDPAKIVLFEYFDFRPMGIKVYPGIIPPKEAFEALGFYIAARADEIRWLAGAWCNLFIRFYGPEVYEKTAVVCFRKPSTVETWAYVERNVPYEARVPGLTLEFHRLVATLKDPQAQKLYLRFCRLYGLRHSQFEQWLKDKVPVEMSQPRYSDRLLEAQQEAYNNEVAYQEQVAENRRLQEEIKRLQPIPDPEPPDLPYPLAMTASNLANRLRETGFSRVTIWADGGMKWER